MAEEIDVMKVPVHPVAKCFPMMDEKSFGEMVDSVFHGGVREKVKLWRDENDKVWLIDGRNRREAAKKAKKPCPFEFVKTKHGDEVVNLVRDLNANRRHLTPTQRATAGVELLELFEKEAKKRQREAAKNAAAKRRGEPVEESDDGDEEIVFAKGEKRRSSRGEASKVTGASPKNIQSGKLLKKNAPDLYAAAAAGDISMNAALKKMNERMKEKELEEAAAEAPDLEDEVHTIVKADCYDAFDDITAESFQLAIIDPPQNDGVDFGDGAKANKKSAEDYLNWLYERVKLVHTALKKNGAAFVFVRDELADGVAQLLTNVGFTRRAWCVWEHGAGVPNPNNFSRTKSHVLYVVKDPKKHVFHPEFLGGAKMQGDVWRVPALAESAKERLPDCPEQLPLAVVISLVGATTLPGDAVLDPFGGSGTTLEACIRAGGGVRPCTIIDSSAKMVKLIEARHKAVLVSLKKGKK